jgi:hypothetical protein
MLADQGALAPVELSAVSKTDSSTPLARIDTTRKHCSFHRNESGACIETEASVRTQLSDETFRQKRDKSLQKIEMREQLLSNTSSVEVRT